jgi:hypothetical protein
MKAVSVKSTKQELIEAYEELSQQVASPTPTSVKSDKSTSPSAIAKAISSLKDLIPELEKEQLAQLKESETAKAKLESFYRDLARTEEELRYKLKKDQTEKSDELDSSLKSRKVEFESDLSSKLADLKDRETKLKDAEDELKALRDDAKVAPARVAMELKKAVESARADEQQVAQHVADLLAKDHEGSLSLAKLKLELLEKATSDQAKEIVALKSAYDHAAEQMKAMATSVISSSRPIVTTTPTTPAS